MQTGTVRGSSRDTPVKLHRMLKIDTHAHILPPDWPNLADKYGDDRFPVMVAHRGPPPHLQGRQVLPRSLGERVRSGSAHRRLREVRRRRAGRLDGAGAVLVLGQAEPGARAASPSQRSHGRDLPQVSAPLRRHRHRAAAVADAGDPGNGTLHRAARPFGRAGRLALRRLESRRAGAVPVLRGRSRSRRRDPRASVGHDGPRIDAEILAALARRHAGRTIARGVLPHFRRRARALAVAEGLLRARRRLVSVHDRAHRARLSHAARSRRDRQRAQSARIFRTHLFRFMRARRRGAALSDRSRRRRDRSCSAPTIRSRSASRSPAAASPRSELDASEQARLYHGTALEWLGLPYERFAPTLD